MDCDRFSSLSNALSLYLKSPPGDQPETLETIPLVSSVCTNSQEKRGVVSVYLLAHPVYGYMGTFEMHDWASIGRQSRSCSNIQGAMPLHRPDGAVESELTWKASSHHPGFAPVALVEFIENWGLRK